ncbi:methyl-accepting chemotaxis protein [Bacillus sp. CGMCC 1.16607]|uniref:methyl-accepting chemotaxis protein n=1 Tax=Bacillus sp. CGMCC 1.16607 TaxID=3351842 RepID=UPI003641A529
MVAATSEQISATSEEFSRANEEITKSIHTISSESDSQVLNIQNANDFIQQLSTQMNQISHNVGNVREYAISSSSTAEEGNAIVVKISEQMSLMDSHASETESIIHTLENKSAQIGEIVSIISSISNQTNLLALNAAIEAARAGEHGKGFAVVAEEVRKLADQTVNAAAEINDLIMEIQKDTKDAVESMNSTSLTVNEGAKLVNSAEKAFLNISQSVQQVAGQIKDISQIVAENNENTDTVTKAIQSILKSAEESSAYFQNIAGASEEHHSSVEEITTATNNLSKLADELQNSINSFRI